MKRASSLFVILGMLAVTRVAAALGKPVDPTLYIGDAAPPLAVAQWVRGEPVKQLDKGTIYVVEFWATYLIDTYARVMFEKGEVARAVELQEQAVKVADRPKFREALDRYKAKLAPTR